MKGYQKEFIDLAISEGALRFGEFTLKSGRKSPYFFNAGKFNDGRAISLLGKFYARAITDAGLDYDVIFGPAYKGIPLVTATVSALYGELDINKPYSFNRKEKKDHGEGGSIVGAPLSGRVLIIDDVITAGTAIRESIKIITAHGAEVAGVVVSLDRQEKGKGDLSSIQEVEKEFNIPVVHICTVDLLLEYLKESGDESNIASVGEYRKEYGC